jgi:hypothetical protein
VQEINDIEYNISEEDDDLLKDHLMTDAKKTCKSAEIGLKENGNNLQDEDDEAVEFKLHSFGEDHMVNPTFKFHSVGDAIRFSSCENLKRCKGDIDTL